MYGTSFTQFAFEDRVVGIEAWDLYEDSSGNIWFPIAHSGGCCYQGMPFTKFDREQRLASAGKPHTCEELIWLVVFLGFIVLMGCPLSLLKKMVQGNPQSSGSP